MKFEHVDKEDLRKCRAVIVQNGETEILLIKCDEGWLCLYSENAHGPIIWADFDQSEWQISKVFYEGDKITITL